MKPIDNKRNYSKSSVVEVYDAERRIGEDDFVNSWEESYFLTNAESVLGSKGGGSVVDFGAGTGKLSLAFARRGYQVTAFDQSEAMLSRLQAKAHAEGLDISCRLVDIVAPRSVDNPTKIFDLAVSSRVLMHVTSPSDMIAHMAELTRYGVIFDAPRIGSANSLLVAARALYGGEVYRCFKDEDLKKICADLGLKVTDALPMFTLPIGFHLKLGHAAFSRALETKLAFARSTASTLFVTAIHPS